MRKDILSLIREQRDITNAIVLTHNIDFVFIQNLLLPALRRCGSPSLTVFADAQSAAATFALQALLVSNLGQRYRVVPVAMAPGFRFHPKAVLLSGRKKVLLLVGSGNLTFGGWRENAEIWASYDSDEGTSEIAAFRRYLDQLIESLALNHKLRGEIEEAFDPGTRDWATNLDPPSGLVGRIGTGPPLLQGMRNQVSAEPIERLIVSAPYFDDEGEALGRLVSAFRPTATQVVVDPEHTNLPPAIAATPPADIEMRPGIVHRTSPQGVERRCFLHGKLYALERADDAVLFVGSANCSRAALTLDGDRGNAELMAVRRLSISELHSEILDEIEIGTVPLQLPESTDVDAEESSPTPCVRLLAAREQDGLLDLAFKAPASWHPIAALVDGELAKLRSTVKDRCECPASATARSVCLRGSLDGVTFETEPLWIDHEASLASNAYRRSLYATARSKAWRTDWDVGDWGELLEALCQDLEYVSPRRALGEAASADNEEGKGEKTFTREDLFALGRNLKLPSTSLSSGSPNRQATLQAILLQWFGNDAEDETPRQEPATETIHSSPSDGDEPVDQPEILGKSTKTPEEKEKERKKDERDRKKACRVIERMATTMSATAYFESREPAHLAQDLKIASLLLRMGADKGWLEREDLLATTYRVWSTLFLSMGEGDAQGWLATRAESQEAREALESPDLAASLFAWSLEISEEPTTPRETQLLLALALAVARHPWFWISAEPEEMASSLANLLKATSDSFDAATIEKRWRSLIELGQAIMGLESAVAEVPMKVLHMKNRQAHIEEGEILVQGALGFCVPMESIDRPSSANVPVLTLHGDQRAVLLIKAAFLNPLNGLLQEVQFLNGLGVPDADLETLQLFAWSLQEGLMKKNTSA